MVYSECRKCGAFHAIDSDDPAYGCPEGTQVRQHRKAAERYLNRTLYERDPRRWSLVYGYQQTVLTNNASDFLP